MGLNLSWPSGRGVGEEEEAGTCKNCCVFLLLLFRPLAPAALFKLLATNTTTHNSFHKVEKPISILRRRNRANLMLKHPPKKISYPPQPKT